MERQLNEKKAAVLATDGFEQSEFEVPIKALRDDGVSVDVISISKGSITGWKNRNWGDKFKVDVEIEDALTTDYDLLVLPGGVMNSDKLRMNVQAVKFVANFFEQSKPIAAICHASWILIEAGIVRGKQVTSYPSLKTDLMNAGAEWVDQEVVMENNLITSRNPKDLPAFCSKIIEAINRGKQRF